MSNLQTLNAEALVTATGGDSKAAGAALAGGEGIIAGRLTSGTPARPSRTIAPIHLGTNR